MDTHPIDPVALIAGLFFGLAGLAILADQRWDDVDVTAFTAAGVMLMGLLLVGVVIMRFVGGTVEPAETDDALSIDDETQPIET